MKAVWQGTLSFALLSIPVKLYNAAQPRQFSFKLLCGKCKTPLRYKRYCPKCKKEVAWQNVLHGFKVGDKWFIFTKDQLAKLKPEGTKEAEIVAFTTADSIDPILFDNNYYVVPQSSAKPYFLLRDVLRATAKVAVVRLILHNKEYTALLRPYRNLLLLTTLHYPYEVREPDFPELHERARISKQEFELAKRLVDSMTRDIKLEEFKDSFAEKLKAIVLGKKTKKQQKAQAEKLVEALQLSLSRRK